MIYLHKLGNIAFKNKKWNAAINYYTEAIKQDNENYILYSNRAASYMKTKQYKKAVTDSVNILRLKNDWPKGWARLGVALYSLDKLDKAKLCFRKILQLDEDKDNKIAKEYIEKIDEQYINLEDEDYSEINKKNAKSNLLSNMLGNIFNNEELKEKLSDPNILNKTMKYKDNPLDILKDKDMMEIMNLMMNNKSK